MTTQVLISSAKTLVEVLANKGQINEPDGVIVLKGGVVQYYIPASEVKVITRDGEKELI